MLDIILEGDRAQTFQTIFGLVRAVDSIPGEDLPLFINTQAVLDNFVNGVYAPDYDTWKNLVNRRLDLGGKKIAEEVLPR